MTVSSGTHDRIGENEQIKCKDQITTKQNTIYHYTSLTGLLAIIKEKSIWASDIRYLNDSKEFSYTIELVALSKLKFWTRNGTGKFIGLKQAYQQIQTWWYHQ